MFAVLNQYNSFRESLVSIPLLTSLNFIGGAGMSFPHCEMFVSILIPFAFKQAWKAVRETTTASTGLVTITTLLVFSEAGGKVLVMEKTFSTCGIPAHRRILVGGKKKRSQITRQAELFDFWHCRVHADVHTVN